MGLICFSVSFFGYSNMTVEEKVGQLLIVHFNGEMANKDAQELIQEVHVGGFILYNWANDLSSPTQVKYLTSGLQNLNNSKNPKIPLFIAVDQEGGVVARLKKGFTIFPGNQALGITNRHDLSEQSAFAIGQELKAVGVNFNLSPVVDINSKPRNAVIGIRSFGCSTDVVIPFTRSAIMGYKRAEIISSLKHFPGHGDVEVDSHLDLPVLKKSKNQLQLLEFLPFRELAPLADTIMTAHILIPEIDPVNCATLSKGILDILRNELSFDGVIISDSLVMEGLLKNCSCIEEAAIKALNAGCDILMLGGKQLLHSNTNLELTVLDVKRIHKALVDAVKSGIILEKRLDEAVNRILTLKKKYDLSEILHSDLIPLVNSKEHQGLAKKIAVLSTKITENKKISLSIPDSKIAIFAPQLVDDCIRRTSLMNFGKETFLHFYKELNMNDEEIRVGKEMAKKADLIIFCSYNAWKNSSQISFINSLSELKLPFVVLSLRDPLDESYFFKADCIITTFSPTEPSIEAACELLLKICE
jgi:beta-N-acetylhexosaminidase